MSTGFSVPTSEATWAAQAPAPVETITSASPELIARLRAQKEAREQEKQRAQDRAAEAVKKRRAALENAQAAEEELRNAEAEASKYDEQTDASAGKKGECTPRTVRIIS